MYKLEFSAYNGAVKIEQLFSSRREAVIAAFALEADRENCSHTITKVEVQDEQ